MVFKFGVVTLNANYYIFYTFENILMLGDNYFGLLENTFRHENVVHNEHCLEICRIE